MSETVGLALGGTTLGLLAGSVALAKAHLLDDAAGWVVDVTVGVDTARTLTAWAVLLGVIVLGAAWSRSAPHRIHIRPHRDHAHGVAEAVVHEALGHAAVGAGVTGTTRGIRARVFPDGSGWCDVPRGPLTPAQSIAITRAGEYVAGPSGCESDRARARRELNRVPSSMRGQVSAEADRLVRQHAGSEFGRRVARALERSGRFR